MAGMILETWEDLQLALHDNSPWTENWMWAAKGRMNAARLSPREQEIALLLFQDLTSKEIAAELFISESTVKNALVHVFDKLGTNTRTGAVLKLLGILK